MRRRSFLLASAALTLPACSPSEGPVPRPSIAPGPTLPTQAPRLQLAPPPGPDAAPRSFLTSSPWPHSEVRVRIRALHRHHLCASVLQGDKDASSYPLLVDLRTQTTRVVHSTRDGSFTTREIELTSLRDQLQHPAQDTELGPTLTSGPAVLDDDHAYIVVARPQDTTTAVHLLKINLNDGTIATSALLSDDEQASGVPTLHLDLSPDDASLLLSGADVGPNYIGLRLSRSDLSVQFDAHSLIPDTSENVQLVGDALKATTNTHANGLVLLADGREVPAPEGLLTVIGQWCYARGGPKEVVMRDLTTGEETTLPDFDEEILYIYRNNPSYPQVWCRQPLFLSGLWANGRSSRSVWRPGETSPMLRWRAGFGDRFEGCAVVGDVLYTWSYSQVLPLMLHSVRSGEVLGAAPAPKGEGHFAVSAWGIATTNSFFPANEWF